jgi:uncharacterized protein with HEPN domain
MRQPDLGRLFDMLDAAEAVREFIAGMDEEAFRNDRKTQSAVIRELMVMGEAAKHLSDDLRLTHPEIPWRRITGMRNVLVHDYRGTSLDALWVAATESVPDLAARVEPLLSETEERS